MAGLTTVEGRDQHGQIEAIANKGRVKNTQSEG